jgi:tight adherence protein B
MSVLAQAFAAGAAGALGAAELCAAAVGLARRRAPAAAGALGALVDGVVRLGSEGREPAVRERRRLLLTGGVLLFAVGLLVAGPVPALALAAAGPWAVGRLLAARRRRYARAVDQGAAAIAVALADALGGGHSLRGALTEAARSLGGPPGHELRLVAGELAAGARTDEALDALRRRVASQRLDALVAACLLQRRAGGDLGRLLRESARGFEDDARVADEVRTATAQARFTGLVVVLLPLGGALLAELASPGFAARLMSSLLTAWLVGLALGLQAVAALLIRRLGRVRW